MQLEWKPEDGLEDLKMKALIATLWECEGNKLLAAERLGVTYRTIRNWMDAYKIQEYRGMPPVKARRMLSGGSGGRKRRTRFSHEVMRKIQAAYGKKGSGPTLQELAERFGTSATTIRKIVRGDYE